MLCVRCSHKIKFKDTRCKNCGFRADSRSGHIVMLLSLCVFLLFLIIFNTIRPEFQLISLYQQKDKNGLPFLESIKRVYCFVTDIQDLEILEKHARDQKWSLGGNTTILYFEKDSEAPDVSAWGLEFEPKYWKNLIAIFSRSRGWYGRDHYVEYAGMKIKVHAIRYVTRIRKK